MSFGKNLQFLRHLRGNMTQEDLAEKMNISLGFCYEELGEYDKAYDMWLEIAHDLEKEGYEVEKKYPMELAEKCKAFVIS